MYIMATIESNQTLSLQSFHSMPAIYYELIRYSKKGLNILIAGVLFFMILLIPELFRGIYKELPYENRFLIQGFGITFIHVFFKILSNIAVYIFYKSKFKYLEQFRISKDPWPWEKNPSEFQNLLQRTLKRLFLNDLIVAPAFTILLIATGNSDVELDPKLYPSIFEVTWQLVFFMIIADTYNYWAHRMMHTPFFYQRSHKLHHEYVVPVSLASEYFTPLEHIVVNLGQTGFGPGLLGSRCHIVTFYIWVFVQTVESADSHSGYDFPWSPFRVLPFSGGADYHDYHHSHNVGNYASYFTYWDSICGTSSHYWKYLEKKYQ